MSGQAPQQAIDNAVAFARLYGVVRYFYPSDASANLDWNRFAIHGVKQVRGAGDVRALEASLQRLFSPFGPGIEISGKLPPAPAPGSPDNQLIAWRYLGAGIADPSVPGPYRAKRTRRSIPASAGSTASRPSCRPSRRRPFVARRSVSVGWFGPRRASRRLGRPLAARRPAEPADGLFRQHGQSAHSRSGLEGICD